MKIKEIAVWIGVIVILIAGMWLMITAVNDFPSASTISQIKIPEVSKEDFIKESVSVSGSAPTNASSSVAGVASDEAQTKSDSAKATLIEYGDFQCPACAYYFSLVKQLSREFNQDLRIIHRFFPLTSIHKNALLSAQTAYAAGQQEKFWEMHDMLYENQKSWADINPYDTFVGYAKEIELDVEKFKTDLESNATKEFIKNAQNKAISLGLNSTPTFFLNGNHIKNPSSYEEFKKIIQDALTK